MNLDQQIDSMKEEMIAAIQACIQIKSVKDLKHAAPNAPFGPGIQKALEWTLALGEKLGFPVKNLDGYAGHIEMGSGDLLGILGHLDVVPEGDGWSLPPYSGAIKENKIYGRGALDDKGPVLTVLFAMKAIKDAGIPLNKTVRLILGTDEESGWADMDYYFKKEELPKIGFAPDADFPLIHAEKGILQLKMSKTLAEPYPHLVRIRGGERPNVVPDLCRVTLKGISPEFLNRELQNFYFPEDVNCKIEAQENRQEVFLICKGVGAHGSLPQKGKNAIIYTLKFLKTLPLSLEEKLWLDYILTYPGKGFYGEGYKIVLEDEPSGRLSLNFGALDLTEDYINFVLDIRYPVTYQLNDIFPAIEKISQAEQFKIEILSHQPSHYVPKDSHLVQALLKAYADVTGLEPFAFAVGGGTYAKVLPQGVAFGPVFPGEPDVIHCADEYISIDKLVLTTKVYAQAILNLASASEGK